MKVKFDELNDVTRISREHPFFISIGTLHLAVYPPREDSNKEPTVVRFLPDGPMASIWALSHFQTRAERGQVRVLPKDQQITITV